MRNGVLLVCCGLSVRPSTASLLNPRIVGDVNVTKAETLSPKYFQGVRKVINVVSVIVGPKEGDTPDRAKYSQGIKFFEPEPLGYIKGDSPKKVEFIGMQNLINAVKNRMENCYLGPKHLEVLANVQMDSWHSGMEIVPNLSFQQVLCRQTRKEISNGELHKFTIQNKPSLSKTSLDRLNEGVLLDTCLALLLLKEISGMPIQIKLDDIWCNAHDGFQKAKQLEISIQDNQIHPPEQSSVYQYFGEYDSILLYQRSNCVTRGYRLKTIKLSSDYHFCPGIHNYIVFTHGSNNVASREIASESMRCLRKKNGTDADILNTGANDRTIRQSSFCDLLGRESSDAISSHPQYKPRRASQYSLSDKVVVIEDSHGLGSHLPLETSVSCDVGGHLENDASVAQRPYDRDVSFQDTPKNGSKENGITTIHGESHLNIQPSFPLENVRDDHRTLERPLDFEPNHDDAFAAEKHHHLSSQANNSEDSTIDDCTEVDLCIKCNKDGELLNCCSRTCLISVHESCLESSPQLETSGLFYCPFCSYRRAVIAYRKAYEYYFQKRKFLSQFVGGDFAHKHQKMSSSSVPVNDNSSGFTRDKPIATSTLSDGQTQRLVVPQPWVISKVTCQGGSTADIEDDIIVCEVTPTIQNVNATLNKGDVARRCGYSDHVEATKNHHLSDLHAPTDTIDEPCPEDRCDARQIHDVRQVEVGMVGNSCSQSNVESCHFRRVDLTDRSSLEDNEQAQQAEGAHAGDKYEVLPCHRANQESEKSLHASPLCGRKFLIHNLKNDLSRGNIIQSNNGEYINIGVNQQLGEPIVADDIDLRDPFVKYAHDFRKGNFELVGNSCVRHNVEVSQFNKEQTNGTSMESSEQALQADQRIIDLEKRSNVSHYTTDVKSDKIVCGVGPPLENVNTDLNEEDTFPHNTEEQIDVAENKQLEEHPSVSAVCYERFTFPWDSSFASYANDDGQGDIKLIIEHNILEAHNEAEEVSTSAKHRNKLTLGKSKRSQPTALSSRRKKLPWSTEEAEALRLWQLGYSETPMFVQEAVHKFGKNSNGQISWIKILEHGRGVFQESRLPVDLKDKWKNLTKKQVSKTQI